MKIIDRIIGYFHCSSTKDAYYAAMKDIRDYNRSMIPYRVVSINGNTFEVVTESYVGGTKKQRIEEFNKLHPECYSTYTKAFTRDEAERYFQYMNLLDRYYQSKRK